MSRALVGSGTMADVAKKKKKSRADAAEKELNAAVEALRARLSDVEKSLAKWKKKATDRKSVVAEVKAELTALRRRLAKAEASATKWRGRAKEAEAAPAPSPAPASSPPVRSATPDETWTVTALRAEARARGVVNYSRKSKAVLIAELR
jgi:peptidoglycan hydrolase CwlO-like protein